MPLPILNTQLHPATQADPLVQSWASFEADTVNLTAITKQSAQARRLTELSDFGG